MKLISIILSAALWVMPKSPAPEVTTFQPTFGKGEITALQSPMQGWEFTLSGFKAPAGAYVEWDMSLGAHADAPETYVLEYQDGGVWTVKDTVTCNRNLKTTKEITTVMRTLRFSNPLKGKLKLRIRAVDGGNGRPEFRTGRCPAAYVRLLGNESPRDTLRVLCIGNSFTFEYQPSWMLKEIAWSQGHYLEMEESLRGGYTFGQHLELGETAKVIAKGGYDVAFFQNQSQTNAWLLSRPDETILTDFSTLLSRVREKSPLVRPVLESTWAYPGKENGGFGTIERFDSLLVAGSCKMADAEGAWISPIGEAFRRCRAERPDIVIYRGDDKHQNEYGAYIKACVNYLIIFGRYFSGDVPCFGLDPRKADYIRGVAEQTVLVTTLDSGLKVDPFLASGQDQLYPFNAQDPLPSAPKGYEPFFIEHYGRHGSRFAYSNRYYLMFKRAMDQAEAKGVLTAYGQALKDDFDSHFTHYMQRVGDLTPAGWNQHERLGREMVHDYPGIFRDSDCSVFASSSDSRRAMMSMSAFGIGMVRACPSLNIREEQGNVYLDGTQPKSANNPFRLEYPSKPFPFSESCSEFCLRKTGNCPSLLRRLFTDPDAALAGIDKAEFLRRLFILVQGMNSLENVDRTDFGGLLTPWETAALWEVDNYLRFEEYYPYEPQTVPVIRDIVRDIDWAMENGEKGATLRFGHDHVIVPMFWLMNVNGYSRRPQSPNDISSCFKNIDCPMAGNIQMVFYKGPGDVLVNIRIHGRNAVVDGLEPVCPGFYKWKEYRKILTDNYEKH